MTKFTDAQLSAFIGGTVSPEDDVISDKSETLWMRGPDGAWSPFTGTGQVAPAAAEAELAARVQPYAYNGLSNASIERLDILAEELAECIVAIGKIKRHGRITTDHVANPPVLHNNVEDLERELGQVLGVFYTMGSKGDLNAHRVHGHAANAWFLKIPYTHHQNEDGNDDRKT